MADGLYIFERKQKQGALFDKRSDEGTVVSDGPQEALSSLEVHPPCL